MVPETAIPVPFGSPPMPIDSETACLLRSFLTPIFEVAPSWTDLQDMLRGKGFRISFRDGHLVLQSLDTGTELCTGRFLGASLAELSRRLGRPTIKVSPDGHRGELLA